MSGLIRPRDIPSSIVKLSSDVDAGSLFLLDTHPPGTCSYEPENEKASSFLVTRFLRCASSTSPNPRAIQE